MTTLAGHFIQVLASSVPSWTASTLFNAGNAVCQPTPPNGYFYEIVSTGGTSGSTQPAFTTVVGSVTAADGSIPGWTCKGPILAATIAYWDQEQSQAINGDLGGTWSPSQPITFLTTSGGKVSVTGPTQVTNQAKLYLSSGSSLVLASGDRPRNGPTHLGRKRRIVTRCMAPSLVGFTETGVGLTPELGLRPDFALSALDAIACVVTTYAASADDSTVTASSAPVQWPLPLDVHNTGTLVDVVVFYRAFLGTPMARVVAISPAGVVTPLTSQASGADVNGYVTAPSPVTTDTVQSWTIPIDGGASASNAVIARSGFTYQLQVIEDATQTTYPGALPVLTPVYLATTGPIDLANAPALIDGTASIPTGSRVLVKNQFDPEENGVYLYPGAGVSFAPATGTPIAQWVASTVYTTGALVQPSGPAPGHGYYFKCTSTSGTGTSGTTQPNWPLTVGATVTDNPGGNQVVWTSEGPVSPWTYNPVVELRTYGLLQGAVVLVTGGNANYVQWFQYTGATIDPANLGTSPALGWFGVPGGLSPSGADVPQDGPGTFAAQGNAYHAVAADFVEILTQEFQ